jgi:hypothetical protein
MVIALGEFKKLPVEAGDNGNRSSHCVPNNRRTQLHRAHPFRDRTAPAPARTPLMRFRREEFGCWLPAREVEMRAPNVRLCFPRISLANEENRRDPKTTESLAKKSLQHRYFSFEPNNAPNSGRIAPLES